MEATKTDLIIYDDSCPMCKAYTQGFVGMGLLTPENRVGFAETDHTLRAKIDLDRGRHEIPLLDQETGEVRYGLRALTHLLSKQWPVLAPILKSKLTYYSLYPLYQIITYNRRLIANSRSPQEGFDCAPDFNAFYRMLYIVFALLAVVGIALALPASFVWAWGGLLSMGALYVRLTRRALARWDAFGHLATVGMITALLSWPLAVLQGVLPPWGTLGWGAAALLVGLNSWRKRMF